MLKHPIVLLLGFFFAACFLAASARAQPPTLMINEVDYDQFNTDTDEFIEILNVSASPINLADYTLYLINGSGGALYLTFPLTGTLASGQYLIVCNNTVTPAPGALVMHFATTINSIQNGAPDGIALVNTFTNTMVDSLSYEGAMTNVAVIPNLGTVSLVHGTPIPSTTADSNSMTGSFSRVPNGQSSGDDATDWQLLPTPTPGASNTGSACTPVPVGSSPQAAFGCPGATATFTAAMPADSGQAPFNYVWRRGGQTVTLNARITSTPSGDTLSCTLSISSLTLEDGGLYEAVVTGSCGSSFSAVARLFVAPADIGVQGGIAGQDGLYDNNDFVVFIGAFFNNEPLADIGLQGGTPGADAFYDNNDFVVFINFFFAGCP